MLFRKVNLLTIFILSYLLLMYLSNLFGNFDHRETETYFSFFMANEALAQEIDWSKYTGNTNNLSTIIPVNWDVIEDKNNDENQTNDIIVFRSPKENSDDPFQENIVISIVKPKNNSTNGEDIKAYDVVEKMGIMNKEFKFGNISSMQISSINKTAESIIYSFDNSGLSFKTQQIFLVTGNNIYIFSLLAEQKEFDKYVSILDEMLKNIDLSN